MRLWRAACAAVCALSLAGTAWHLFHNAAPPSYDDGWYLEYSFRFFHALRGGPLALLREYTESFGFKAPLISLLPLPLYALFGPSERIAAWANLPLLALALWGVFGVARRLYGERAAWGAAAALALAPIVYGVSRIYFVECLLTALVCCAVREMLRPGPPRRRGARVGFWLGLGLLGKVLFPLYIIGPAWALRRELRDSAKSALLIGGIIAASWYAFNTPAVVGFALSAGFGRIARDYGGFPLAPEILAHYGGTLGRDALSWPYLAAALALGAAAWRRRPTGWRWGSSERLLAAWIGLPLLVFTLGVNKEIRYAAPALPAFAVAVGALAAGLSRRASGAALVAALALLPLGVFCSQTFGAPRMARLNHNGPPSADPGWERGAVVDALAAAAPGGATAAVALEHRLFNANNLSSLAASRGLPLRFVNLGYAQASVEGALIRLKDKGARYLIFVDGTVPELPLFLNRANDALRARVSSGALPARRLAVIPIADGLTAELYGLTERP